MTDAAESADVERSSGPLAACAGAFLVVLLFHGVVPTDPDTPWHIAQARLMLHRWSDGHFTVNARDAFSWTAFGHRWHPNGWGFQAVLGVFYDVAGWPGVALLRALLLGALVVVAWRFSDRLEAGRWARAGAVWVAMVFVVPWATVRPQLVSFVLLVVCLDLTARALDSSRAPPGDGNGSDTSPLVAHLVLAATIALWAALHGAVVAGVVALVIMCAGEAMDRRSWQRPLLTASVCVVASLASPYGVSLWSYAVSNTKESENLHIEEWRAPSITRGSDVAVMILLLGVAVVAVVLALRSGRGFGWRLLLPALVLTAFTLQGIRNQPFALLALLPFGAHALTAAGSALASHGWTLPMHPGRAVAAMSLGALLGGAIHLGASPLDVDPMQSPDYPQVAKALPSGCRLLNEYDFGGYVILARPDVPVSQDGRNNLYGPTNLHRQELLLEDARPGNADMELRRLGITCVLAHEGRGLLASLAGLPGWRRLAQTRRARPGPRGDDAGFRAIGPPESPLTDRDSPF